MPEPDAMWGHIPVRIETFCEVKGHEDWFRLQLKLAIDESATCTDKLSCIPDAGFYVRGVVGECGMEPRKGSLVCSIVLVEELDGYLEKPQVTECPIVQKNAFHAMSILGTDMNPFRGLFEAACEDLPWKWQSYLEWRRARRWKQVPDWLLKLRRKEKTARRSVTGRNRA